MDCFQGSVCLKVINSKSSVTRRKKLSRDVLQLRISFHPTFFPINSSLYLITWSFWKYRIKCSSVFSASLTEIIAERIAGRKHGADVSDRLKSPALPLSNYQKWFKRIKNRYFQSHLEMLPLHLDLEALSSLSFSVYRFLAVLPSGRFFRISTSLSTFNIKTVCTFVDTKMSCYR